MIYVIQPVFEAFALLEENQTKVIQSASTRRKLLEALAPDTQIREGNGNVYSAKELLAGGPQPKPKFITDSKELLNTIGEATGDTARLAHRLSQAVDKLEAIYNQASAQFRAGDRHATFSKQTIEAIFRKGA